MHTLNEQSVLITGDTVDEAFANLKNWISSTFGWILEGDVIYPRNDKKLGLVFSLSASNFKIQAKNLKGTVSGSVGSATITAEINVRYHVSAGESVKYFRINSDVYNALPFMVAEASNGELYAFVSSSTAKQWSMLSEESLVGVNSESVAVNDQLLHFSVTKLPAMVSGGEMKELFLALSTRTFSPTGFNVSFPNTVHRLVSMKGATNASAHFSFPVSD